MERERGMEGVRGERIQRRRKIGHWRKSWRGEEERKTTGRGWRWWREKLSVSVRERKRERRIQSCSLAPGTTFLSAMASLSAKCTFDVSPHMLL